MVTEKTRKKRLVDAASIFPRRKMNVAAQEGVTEFFCAGGYSTPISSQEQAQTGCGFPKIRVGANKATHCTVMNLWVR
jgi:hypothetical protein